MALAGRYLRALTCAYTQNGAVNLQRRHTIKHVEELPRRRVMVSELTGTRWHDLFDHRQLRLVEQTPAIADFSPTIVRRIVAIDDS